MISIQDNLGQSVESWAHENGYEPASVRGTIRRWCGRETGCPGGQGFEIVVNLSLAARYSVCPSLSLVIDAMLAKNIRAISITNKSKSGEYMIGGKSIQAYISQDLHEFLKLRADSEKVAVSKYAGNVLRQHAESHGFRERPKLTAEDTQNIIKQAANDPALAKLLGDALFAAGKDAVAVIVDASTRCFA